MSGGELRERDGATADRGAHDVLAFRGNAIAMGVRDLGDQAVSVTSIENARQLWRR